VAVWAFLVTILACITPRSGATQTGAGADSIVHLYQGEDSHTHYLLRAVVRDSTSFARLWGQILNAPIPRVDFNRYTVIAVTMGPQGSPGNKIAVVAVESGTRILQVRVELTLWECPAPGVITYPADVVRVPESRWVGVTFVDRYIVERCR